MQLCIAIAIIQDEGYYFGKHFWEQVSGGHYDGICRQMRIPQLLIVLC